MVFELRHFDTVLLRFDAQMDTAELEPKILWVAENQRALLPLDLEVTGSGGNAGPFPKTVPTSTICSPNRG